MTLRDTRPEYDILNLRKQPNKIWPRASRVGPWMIDWPTSFEFTKDTKFATIGSCFAVELEKWLKLNGYRYVETEGAMDGSGPWGKVYHTYGLAQIFEYAAGLWSPAEGMWLTEDQYWDPMRKWVHYDSTVAFLQGRLRLRRETKQALQEADVLVMTVGLNELWGRQELDRDGRREVFFQAPPRAVFDPERHEFFTASASENWDNLSRAIRAAKKINPDLQILLTLSPVPLRATFRTDVDVFTANLESKNLLHGVIKSVVRRFDQVEYFPSYEIAMSHGFPFRDDGRHVRPQVVEAIMERFASTYVAST